MNRTLMSKITLKYDDVIVDERALIADLTSNPDVILTDAQAIVGFFAHAVRLTAKTSIDCTVNDRSLQIGNYPDVDGTHQNTGGHMYRPSMGDITAIDNQLNICMLNMTDAEIAQAEFDDINYVAKKITLEIHTLNKQQMQAELANMYIDESTFDINLIENLYDLLKPFVSNTMPSLDEKGYSRAVDDGQKISLYANAMRYEMIFT